VLTGVPSKKRKKKTLKKKGHSCLWEAQIYGFIGKSQMKECKHDM
jgi:hypothetical protein